jgi:hypothetical protein
MLEVQVTITAGSHTARDRLFCLIDIAKTAL